MSMPYYPPFPDNPHNQIASVKRRTSQKYRTPFALLWQNPTLLHSFAQPSSPLAEFQYRLHMDDSLEFKGHLDVSAATSGTVAVTLPPFWVRALHGKDQYWHSVVVDGSTFFLALVFINATSGDVTLFWPVSLATGLEGPVGPAGSAGPRGMGVISGAGAPSSGTGSEDDTYIDATTGNVYVKSGGTWTLVGNIKGATGATGATGPGWIVGTGVPSSGTGNNGDLFLDTATYNIYTKSGGTWSLSGNIKGPPGPVGIQAFFAGAGSALTTAADAVDIEVPFAGTIIAVRLFADQTGSCVADIRKSTYSGFPPSSSIVASAPPTLSSASKSQDTTLSGWTTGVSSGDVLRFLLSSVTTITRLTISLTIQRS